MILLRHNQKTNKGSLRRYGKKFGVLALAFAVSAQAMLLAGGVQASNAPQNPRVTFKYGSSTAGFAQVALADVDGNGVKDFVIGNVYTITDDAPSSSLTFVVFNSPSLPSVVDLANLGTSGFEIMNSDGSHQVGGSVADAGDKNGDGRHNLLVTAQGTGNAHDGPQNAFLIWGKTDTATIDLNEFQPSNGVKFTASSTTNGVNFVSAAGLGDINGDGFADLAFGDSTYGGWDCGGSLGYGCGQVSVVYGRQTWPASIDLDTLSQDENGFNVIGTSGSDIGLSVTSAGDVNGDGRADLALSSTPGSVGPMFYVVFGGATNDNINGISASTLASRGFVISSSNLPYPSNQSIVGLGDVNGDSLDDVAVSSSGQHTGTPPAVYTFFGKADSNTIQLGDNGTTSVTSANFNDGFGLSSASTGTSLLAANPSAQGSDSQYNYGKIFGFPHSSLTSSFNLPELNGGFVVEGASPNMQLGFRLAGDSSTGEILADVRSADTGYVAAVVPAANATIVLPPPVVAAFNAGGGNAGNFVADSGYSGGTQYSSSAPVDTSGVLEPAPQDVYQSARYGNTLTYTFSNLASNASYTLRLHFNELYWGTSQSGGNGGVGSRVFNVAVNGQSALTNFDIYSAAGSANRAVVKQIPTTADANGDVTVTFTALSDNALINGLELFKGTLPPLQAPPTAGSAYIDAGGGAVGSFAADYGFNGGAQYTSTDSVDTTQVTNPAPEAVYQSVRYGNSFSYTIGNLVPNTSFNVRLDFNELYWGTLLSGYSGGSGSRVFNVDINGSQVLNNFDIYSEAGGANKAIAENITAQSSANGIITIQFTSTQDNAMVNGIELTQE